MVIGPKQGDGPAASPDHEPGPGVPGPPKRLLDAALPWPGEGRNRGHREASLQLGDPCRDHTGRNRAGLTTLDALILGALAGSAVAV